MDLATLGIRIDNGSAIAALDQLATRLDIVGVRGESTVGRLKSALTGLAAATGLTIFGAKILRETIEAQNAMAQLEARIKATGGAAGLSVQQLDAFSQSMQRVSVFSDEAVKGVESMLLTFNKIRGETFTRATKDVLDLAQAMGSDLQSAAIQVGKALQDPEQGLLALRRSGVSFTDAQQDLIKSLFAAGETAKAQAMILRELEKEFGGAAEAARNTLGGALAYLKNQFGDAFEVSSSSSAGIVRAINAIADAIPNVRSAIGGFFIWFEKRSVDAAVAWQKFLNLFRREAGLNEALDKWKAEQYALIDGTGKLTTAVGGLTHAREEEIDVDLKAIEQAKKVRDANADMVRVAQQGVQLAGLEGDAQAKLQIEYDAVNKAIQAQRELKGQLLAETIAAIEKEKELKIAAVDRAAAVKKADEEAKKQQEYIKDVQRIWADGIGKITTDGFKSFQDFFEDVFQLFSRLMRRMEEEGATNGAAYKWLGIGSAAITGGSTGYASGNPLMGLLAGGLAGASFGPIGIAAGALSGAAGGLLGAARAHDEAARALREAAVQLKNDVASYVTGSYGNDTQSQLLANNQRYIQLYNDLRKAFEAHAISMQEFKEQTDALNGAVQRYHDSILAQAEAAKEAADANERLKNAQATSAYQLRFLTATGQSDAAFALQQKLERDDAARQGYTQDTLAALDIALAAEKAEREREKQTQLLTDQLSTAQQQLDSLKQVYDSLTQFGDSLKIGQYSPLSPRQQLDAARSQLGTLYSAALGGDQAAAGQFTGAAQSFLDASRRYNASGAGYVLDFNSVAVMTDKLKDAFGIRVSDAQRQVDLLTSQLDVLKDINQSILDLGTTLITSEGFGLPVSTVGTGQVSRPQPSGSTRVAADIVAMQEATTTATLTELRSIRAAIEETGRSTARSVDELAQRIA